MTLKEIEKIIDEANYVGYPRLSKMNEFYPVIDKEYEKDKFRNANDDHYVFHYEDGEIYYYYKLNKETGDMTLLAKIDHIDKEKKVVKKKLGDMTNEETDQVRQKICFDRKACTGCPLRYKSVCLATYFKIWKNLIKETENREFEIEVEE